MAINVRNLQAIYRAEKKKYPTGWGKPISMAVNEMIEMGINPKRDYFDGLVTEFGDYYLTLNESLISDATFKRLAKANFRLMVSNNYCYFYTPKGDRVDPVLEKLLKAAVERLF